MDAFGLDLRFALRQLAKRPGLAISAILTLAIGMAVTTTAFTAVNAFFIKGNAGSHLEGTGWILTSTQSEAGQTSIPEFERLGEATRDALVTAAEGRMPLAWRHDRASETVWALLISSQYFQLLEVVPVAGRLPSPIDREVALVSERFWRERLNESPLGGLHMTINGTDLAVIGVMPTDFRGPGGTYAPEIWVPLDLRRLLGLPARFDDENERWLSMVGRIKPGVTLAEVETRLLAGASAMAGEWPETHGRRTARFRLMRDGFGGDEARGLRWIAAIAMTAVGLVLVLACFNVANLLLARAVDREREMGIRAAVGAGRLRLLRQLITEGFVLAGVAGLVSGVIVSWSQELLAAFALPSPIPQRIDVSPDRTVFLFLGVLVLVAGVVPGLAPARHAARIDLVRALSSQSYGIAGGRSSWGRNALVVLQVSGSTLLLIIALLFVRSFVWVGAADPGFESERAVVVELNPSLQNYAPARARLLVQRLLERVDALPGVSSVAAADRIPFYIGYARRTPVAAGDGSCADGTCPEFATYAVGPGFFATMGIPLVTGREFDGSPETASGVVVTETFARRRWPDGAATGRVLRLGLAGTAHAVIAVAKDTKHRGFSEAPVPALYVPMTETDFTSGLTLVARTETSPGPLVAAIRQAMFDVDPDVPPVAVKTMAQWLEGPRYPARVGSGFFGACGLLALALAITGLFGVISHTVRQRTREFGVRIAVGATRGALIRSVLSSSAWLVAPGLVLGALGASLVAQGIRIVLMGVDTTSPSTYLAVVAAHALVAIAACLVPARRASRVDPLTALRAD